MSGWITKLFEGVGAMIGGARKARKRSRAEIYTEHDTKLRAQHAKRDLEYRRKFGSDDEPTQPN